MRSTRYSLSRHSRLPATVAVLAGVMLVTGCGGSSSDEGSTSGDGGGTKITVDESDFALKMSPMTLEAGTYTFVAKNVGDATHALEIEGQGVEEETKELSPGQSASLEVTLKKGSYELYCPVGGHRAQGMEMTLTVT